MRVGVEDVEVAGRSARTRSSQDAATCRARSSASTELNIAVSVARVARWMCAGFVPSFAKDTVGRARRAIAREPSSRPRIGGSMKRIHLLVLLTALALPLAAASARGSGSGSVVVAEVFAAGGNSGAAYSNDYVELFNRGASAVAIDGWSLQYASAFEHVVAVDGPQRHDPGGRPVSRPARLGRGQRRGAPRARRDRHLEPRRHRRQGRASSTMRPHFRAARPPVAARPSPASRISSATAVPLTSREVTTRRPEARPMRSHVPEAAAPTRTTTRPTSQPRRRIP